jgi:hypothetical protein
VTIQTGLPVATAAPIPDEISPSIPFAPRLHMKVTRLAADGRNASWSRIGIEEAV